jgi:glutamine cyclotransferase
MTRPFRPAFALLILALPGCAQADSPWTLVATYPHDEAAFTQGLSYLDGALYETTGQKGQSELREVNLADGAVKRSVKLDATIFGEGSTPWKDKIISLSWRNGMGFVWNRKDFSLVRSFSYRGEGWGLTQDGKRLIMSDGSATLRLLDPETFEQTGALQVTFEGKPVPLLNELEYVNGEVLANIWFSSRIARIDPATGKVKDWIDLSSLAAKNLENDPDAVLNGIAWDAQKKRLFVTGKYWPHLYEIRLKK